MAFELSPELRSLQATVRKIASETVRPRVREIDDTGLYPQDLYDVFVEAGLTKLAIPETYGGTGAGVLGLAVAIAEVARYSAAAALMLFLTRVSTGPLLIAGSEDQKRRYVGAVAAGAERAAFALSEANAGSDVMGIQTTARPSGSDWMLTGVKSWVSGIREADWYCVVAKTGPVESRQPGSVSAFIVERSWPGVSAGRIDRKMGTKGVDTGALVLEDVRVPAENVVGDVGGFHLVMLGLNTVRPLVAAQGVGVAEGALIDAVDYLKARQAFGQAIASFQGIQWKIAELATELEAARLLTYRAASLVDEGRFTKEWVPFLSMAKYYATELAVKASGSCLHLLGAAGYTKDHLAELRYRDARQLPIVDGTTEIQLGLIARGVLDGTLWPD